MALSLNGQTTGYTELNAPANGDSVILTMPGNDGNAGQYLQTDGSGTLSWQTVTIPDNLTFGTAASLTGQTTVTYSSIPSNTKRITLLISGYRVSTSTSRPVVRIGSGGSVATTGYSGAAGYGTVYNDYTTGFGIYYWGSTSGTNGYLKMSIENMDGNTWLSSHAGAGTSWNGLYGSGVVTLSGTLDTLDITSVAGNFTDGTVNVIYEAA